MRVTNKYFQDNFINKFPEWELPKAYSNWGKYPADNPLVEVFSVGAILVPKGIINGSRHGLKSIGVVMGGINFLEETCSTDFWGVVNLSDFRLATEEEITDRDPNLLKYLRFSY